MAEIIFISQWYLKEMCFLWKYTLTNGHDSDHDIDGGSDDGSDDENTANFP